MEMSLLLLAAAEQPKWWTIYSPLFCFRKGLSNWILLSQGSSCGQTKVIAHNWDKSSVDTTYPMLNYNLL